MHEMGRINENGDFQFEPGHGSGLEGMPYKAEWPQGQFGAVSSGQRTLHGGRLPYWTRDSQRRLHVMVEYFEERAKFTGLTKGQEIPTGSLEERLKYISAVLEKARRAEMRKLELKDTRKSLARLRHLKGTGRHTDWVGAVLCDYYFGAADCPDGMTQSWDAGQCAYRHGRVDKIFVKQLLRQVNKIGGKLYPEPEEEPVVTTTQPDTPLTPSEEPVIPDY